MIGPDQPPTDSTALAQMNARLEEATAALALLVEVQDRMLKLIEQIALGLGIRL